MKRGARAPRICFKCGVERYVDPRSLEYIVSGMTEMVEGVPLCMSCYRTHEEGGASSNPSRSIALRVAGAVLLVVGRIIGMTMSDDFLPMRLGIDLLGLALLGVGIYLRYAKPGDTAPSPERLNLVNVGADTYTFEVKPEIAERAVALAASANQKRG